MSDLNEIIMIYKPKEGNKEKIRIFGTEFIENNKDICKIIYNNEEYELKEYFNEIDKDYNNKDIISFKLTNINNITLMTEIFSGCNSVISLPDISNWDLSNVKSMNGIYFQCESLISLPDLSKWNLSNVEKFVVYLMVVNR